MNVAIACGGTGGHLFPGLAVAEQLLKEGHDVLLLVSKKDVDRHADDLGLGARVLRIPAIGLPRRKFSPGMIAFGLKLFASLVACQFHFMRHRTDVVLGMGGFTSAAAVLAAQLHWIPTVIHESNAIPGKANRWAARFARFAACGFAACVERFRKGKAVWTGTPVRASLKQVPRGECLDRLALDPQKPTVLVMGGSQGSHAINEATWMAWPRLMDFNIIHLTGNADFQAAKDIYEGVEAPVRVEPFLREMEVAYGAADIVVSRAGAASLTEIAHYRIPNILVPYPLAAEQHQQKNAEIFEKAGAGVILPQEKLSAEELARSIHALWRNEGKRQKMSERLDALIKPNAAGEVVRLLRQAARFEPLADTAEAAA